MIGPSFGDPSDPETVRARVGIAEFTELAARGDTGGVLRRGRLAARGDASPLPGLTACAPADLPDGFAGGSWARLPLVDMPVYLDHLVGRLHAAGGRIVETEVRSLAELAEYTPRIVHCAGLGARELVGDPQLRPVRGQQVVVENPGLDEFFISAPFEPDWTAYWPHPGHVVLGGSQDDDTTTEPDPVLADRIRARCIAVEPRLATARVLAHQVGLRPVRSAVRLEVEMIGGARCVHNYGHGGTGVTTSWGSAREAVALLVDDPVGAAIDIPVISTPGGP